MQYVYVFFIFLSPVTAMASACCGSSSIAPSLITGENRAQTSLSTSYAQVIGDVQNADTPVFRNSQNTERTQVLKLEGAYAWTDRLQSSVALPFVRKERAKISAKDQSIGVGDVGVGAAYEAVPEWSYSAWRPRGFLFFQTVFPTGRSSYESQNTLGVDAAGKGFYTFSVGSFWLKQWSGWDVLFSFEAHRSMPRTYAASNRRPELRLIPGFGGSAVLGGGWSPQSVAQGNVRFGLNLSPQYEGTMRVQGFSDSVSGSQLVWAVGASISYIYDMSWSVSASYQDQTLLGPARNTQLSRSGVLLAQHFWSL